MLDLFCILAIQPSQYMMHVCC